MIQNGLDYVQRLQEVQESLKVHKYLFYKNFDFLYKGTEQIQRDETFNCISNENMYNTGTKLQSV